MIRATLALAAAAALGLAACQTSAPSATDSVHNSATFENQNAGDLNSNSSVQPGGAGPSPNGGSSNPGTSGTVTNHPGTPSNPR